MASGTTRRERNDAVAAVASTLFGTPVPHEHVIDETLRWGLPRPTTPTAAELRQALLTPLPSQLRWEDLVTNPLAAWIEATFGLRADEEERLRRRDPITLLAGAQQLANETGLALETCAQRLQQFIQRGNAVKTPGGQRPFAFKLHQFFSQGGAVFATVEQSQSRYLTLDGQHYAPGDDTDRLLFPLVFCRVCGQELGYADWALAMRHPLDVAG